jgi:RimJ/RimL family protein N-acetyltransferase
MIIRELYPIEQPAIAALLLTLSAEDRYRRFCRPMTDEALRHHVARIDWSEATVLGAFDECARLVGVLELCDAGSAAEIGIVVAHEHRVRGVASALMERALLKAKVLGKARVTLSCLAENLPMRRLARSVGLEQTMIATEVTGELALEPAQIDDVVAAATGEMLDKLQYTSALVLRSCTDLVQEMRHAAGLPPLECAAEAAS